MSRMVSIQMDSDDMIEALVERLHTWTDDEDVREVFEQYYENAVFNGCFDGCEFNVMSIVDNDYVNNMSITSIDEYNEAREEYLKDNTDKEIPTWDELNAGDEVPSFIGGYCIEAKTDNVMLISQ